MGCPPPLCVGGVLCGGFVFSGLASLCSAGCFLPGFVLVAGVAEHLEVVGVVSAAFCEGDNVVCF